MEEARHRIPLSTKMLRIPAAEVLRRPHILWRFEGGKEVIILGSIEWPLTINRGLTNHAWLMDVEVLESVVRHTVGKEIAVPVAIGAASATSRYLAAKKILATGNLGFFS